MGKSYGADNILETNVILADLYDLINVFRERFFAYTSKDGKPQKIKPYPVPGRDNDKNDGKIGRDALPIPELREWIKERQENGKR